jgi:hypothetical protein
MEMMLKFNWKKKNTVYLAKSVSEWLTKREIKSWRISSFTEPLQTVLFQFWYGEFPSRKFYYLNGRFCRLQRVTKNFPSACCLRLQLQNPRFSAFPRWFMCCWFYLNFSVFSTVIVSTIFIFIFSIPFMQNFVLYFFKQFFIM